MQLGGTAGRRQKEAEESIAAAEDRRETAAAPRSERRIFEACDCVIDLAAAFFNVSVRELRRPGRATDDITRVRQIAMYLAHVMLGLSMGDIGRAFGRDRTTVMHACHLVEDMRDDIELDAIVGRMEKLVAAALSGHRLYWRSGRFSG